MECKAATLGGLAGQVKQPTVAKREPSRRTAFASKSEALGAHLCSSGLVHRTPSRTRPPGTEINSIPKVKLVLWTFSVASIGEGVFLFINKCFASTYPAWYILN